MTVVFTEGFDMYNGIGANTGLAARFGFLNTSTSSGQGLTTGRFAGGQAYSTFDAGGSFGVVWNAYRTFNPGVGLTGSFGIAWATSSISTGNGRAFALGFGTTIILTVYVQTSGAISVYRGDAAALLCTSAVSLVPLSTYKYLELEFFIDDTTGYVRLYMDGTLIASATGVDTKVGSETTINTVLFTRTSNSITQWYDDIYMSDSATALGPQKVETLRPSADVVGFLDWTPNSGTAHFSRVNETLVDGGTTYNEAGTAGNIDLYDLGNLSSLPSTISAVNLIGNAVKTDAGARTVALEVRHSGTLSDGSAQALSTGYGFFDRLMPINPVTGVAWTAADVNALQVGMKVVS